MSISKWIWKPVPLQQLHDYFWLSVCSYVAGAASVSVDIQQPGHHGYRDECELVANSSTPHEQLYWAWILLRRFAFRNAGSYLSYWADEESVFTTTSTDQHGWDRLFGQSPTRWWQCILRISLPRRLQYQSRQWMLPLPWQWIPNKCPAAGSLLSYIEEPAGRLMSLSLQQHGWLRELRGLSLAC